jgi:hypothetical protein
VYNAMIECISEYQLIRERITKIMFSNDINLSKINERIPEDMKICHNMFGGIFNHICQFQFQFDFDGQPFNFTKDEIPIRGSFDLSLKR